MSTDRQLLFDGILVATYALSFLLLVRSARTTGDDSPRLLRVFLAIGGLLIPATLLLLHGGATMDLLERLSDGQGYSGRLRSSLMFRAAAFVGFAASGLIAGATVTGFFSPAIVGFIRAIPWGSRRWAGKTIAAFAVMPALLGVTLIVLLVALETAGEAASAFDPGRSNVTVEQRHALPARPLALAMYTERVGYATLHPDRIVRFTLPDDPEGALQIETVADGLAFPRGIAISNNTVYVTELGRLPCDPSASLDCGVPDELRERLSYLELGDHQLSDLNFFEGSSASVVAFDIGSDGGLDNRRVLASGLPVTNFLHALNGLAVGPDGRVYVSVGGLDGLWNRLDALSEIPHPRADWVGTVLAVSPDDGEVEVFARGFRNVYDLTFDGDGNLFGADNDGPTLRGWRREEVVWIQRGEHFGYPTEGTFPPYQIRDSAPLWVLDIVAPSGITWAGPTAFGDGLFVGAQGTLVFVPLAREPGSGRPYVSAQYPLGVREVIAGTGWVTALDTTPGGRLVAGTFPLSEAQQPELIVISFE